MQILDNFPFQPQTATSSRWFHDLLIKLHLQFKNTYNLMRLSQKENYVVLRF